MHGLQLTTELELTSLRRQRNPFSLRLMMRALVAIWMLTACFGLPSAFAQDSDFPPFELPGFGNPSTDIPTPLRPTDERDRLDERESRDRRVPLAPVDEMDERSRRSPRRSDRDSSGSIPLDPVDPDELDGLRNFGTPGSPGTRRSNTDPLSEDESVLPPDTEGRFPKILPRTNGVTAFDWSQQPVSIADIEIGRSWPFQHGEAALSDEETSAYVDIVRAIDNKRTTPPQIASGVNVTSLWEASFYRYAQVRRQAWTNGTLKLHVTTSNLSDPFSSGSTMSATDELSNVREPRDYSLQIDMKAHPKDFIGRPIVLYGLFKPRGVRELQAVRSLEGEEQVYRLQTGLLRNLQDTETIAMIDAASYVDSQSQTEPSRAWPTTPIAIPVMVKGWFIKRWQEQPLIYTDVLRILTPRPYDKYIQDFVVSRQPVTDDESWLYYETLRQMQVTSSDVQSAIAIADQNQRVQELLDDAKQKASADLLSLENQLRAGKITREGDSKTAGYEASKRRLERQMELRVRRAEQNLKSPETFPMFVDLFDDPDRWQGRLITLRGHVRRISKYNGDSTLFDGQTLYELWLFPADSYHNPAVIVTPTIPQDFPVSCDLVDGVTVTGCFFKMYRYRGQEKIRPAPLVLAGRVNWNPTPEHVLKLVESGHISANAPIVAVARSQGRRVSDTTILIVGFLALMAAMTVWGRVQRDRRERKRLLSLVDEKPIFRQTPQDLYSRSFDSAFESTRG